MLAAWSVTGTSVAPVPSASGRLVETVPTPLGDVHATAVLAAPGVELTVDSSRRRSREPGAPRSPGATATHPR